MLIIDDTAFPIPAPSPMFSSLTVGDVFRRSSTNTYCQKSASNAAYDFTVKNTISVPATEAVQPVSATLTISAP